MSILIKGTKMPKECEYCMFAGFGGAENEYYVCMFNGKWKDRDSHGRMESCPLVEIQPHGRLIDGAALKTKLNNIHDFLLGDCEFSELATNDKARIDELENCIAEVVNASTVIESEEQENEL